MDEEEAMDDEATNDNWLPTEEDDFASSSENTALLTAASRGTTEIIISPSSPCSSALDLSCSHDGEELEEVTTTCMSPTAVANAKRRMNFLTPDALTLSEDV
jgi:hypothetical protein